MTAAKRTRLDNLVVERGLAPTRQRAQALIRAGKVLVDQQVTEKPGTAVSELATIALKELDHPYVSRGGLKLAAAFAAFALDVTDALALDVGASTGGFTDCLLERGARHVIAVDVGYGQLDWKLRTDPRVTAVERMNARNLTHAGLRDLVHGTAAAAFYPPTVAVTDVSFISLKLVLEPIASVLGPDRPVIALCKPQFEAPKNHVGKGGVVRDPAHREAAIVSVLNWAEQQGFVLRGRTPSPIHGPKGNVEELVFWITGPQSLDREPSTATAGYK